MDTEKKLDYVRHHGQDTDAASAHEQHKRFWPGILAGCIQSSLGDTEIDRGTAPHAEAFYTAMIGLWVATHPKTSEPETYAKNTAMIRKAQEVVTGKRPISTRQESSGYGSRHLLRFLSLADAALYARTIAEEPAMAVLETTDEMVKALLAAKETEGYYRPNTFNAFDRIVFNSTTMALVPHLPRGDTRRRDALSDLPCEDDTTASRPDGKLVQHLASGREATPQLLRNVLTAYPVPLTFNPNTVPLTTSK